MFYLLKTECQPVPTIFPLPASHVITQFVEVMIVPGAQAVAGAHTEEYP